MNLTTNISLVAALLLKSPAGNLDMWLRCKQSVVDLVNKSAAGRVVDTALSIDMPCGNKLILKTVEDILALEPKDVPCPCGDPTHWLIKCQEEPNEV